MSSLYVREANHKRTNSINIYCEAVALTVTEDKAVGFGTAAVSTRFNSQTDKITYAPGQE